jgi:1-acyl-sn-glycerol-3-phosphate acyltransferase
VLNHLSWLDIPVVGGHVRGSFVAKAEVGDMGFVRRLADLQRTIYVERERRSRVPLQAGAIVDRLAGGGNVILFPEGTSNDGVRVLPFKSSLFSVLQDERAAGFRIQPLTLAYTQVNGLPLTRNRLIELAWIGDLDLGPHLIACMKLGRIRARIVPHEPVRLQDFGWSRKALARHCQQVVADGYRALLRGVG